MVEQWDTEAFAALSAGSELPDAPNIDAASHLPPVLTKTWFHTGAYFEGQAISRQFAEEYYREGDPSLGEAGLSDEQREAMLLPDTVLPESIIRPDGTRLPWSLSPDETRQAYRALKGAILRQEVYALDGSEEADRPYSVSERNYTLDVLQPSSPNRHAVFLSSPRQTLDFQYERKLYARNGKQLADPRVSHTMTLAVDAYGNVLQSVAIGYGRRHNTLDPLLTNADTDKQTRSLVTLTENRYTNPVAQDDSHRTPLPYETRSYELLNVTPDASVPQVTKLFGFEEMLSKTQAASDGQHELPYEDLTGLGVQGNAPFRRLIEQVRTMYRKDDLSTLLPLGELDSLALPGETYKLAFTPGLLAQVYQRNNQALLPNPAEVLAGQAADRGGYVDLDTNGHWWLPSGRVFYGPNAAEPAPAELAEATVHFFLPRRFRDPFGNAAVVEYDAYDLLVSRTADAVGNTASAVNDYRVLQPWQMTDPNGNRSVVAFDVLGLVVGSAVQGKESQQLGDSLVDFRADLSQDEIDAFFADPKGAVATSLLANASSRIVYDETRFQRLGLPPFAASLVREVHASDLADTQESPIQLSFSYSDGFGREIQKKIQAEPGQLVAGGPQVSPRWVGSGWTIFNNKGKPVRQYEPFFSATHDFEFGVQVGVSPVLFYDPVERVVATLHPNHTYEKVVFDPWQQTTFDVNDTVAAQATETGDPRTDADIGSYVTAYFETQPDTWQTWHQARITGAQGGLEQSAADKASQHANTPTTAHLDALGRPFLTVAHNRFERNTSRVDEQYTTRVELDIEGNQRAVTDAKDRVVMRYAYDMLGNRIYQASMEAGERWMLNDVTGKPIRAWDKPGDLAVVWAMTHCAGRFELFVSNGTGERLAERTIYGEAQGDALNHRGQVFQVFDAAGVVTNEAYDFKGNLLQSRRDLLSRI